eukprot:4747344-Pleurochrysis_carterae.AAC.1
MMRTTFNAMRASLKAILTSTSAEPIRPGVAAVPNQRGPGPGRFWSRRATGQPRPHDWRQENGETQQRDSIESQ